MGYWERKHEMSAKAIAHTEEMSLKFAQEIENSVKNTKIYRGDIRREEYVNAPYRRIILDPETTTQALETYLKDGEKIAILNFASYKNPGGCFIEGSTAQEECLCHSSFLYNVLKEFQKSYYDVNAQQLNHSLYTNAGLYTPNVAFNFNGFDWIKTNVITCAAPNFKSAYRYCDISKEENSKVLRERCRFVLDIAYDNQIETLILGAFGCGVFGQNPEEVCAIFLEENNKMNRPFNKIVFAVPQGTGLNAMANYYAFKRIIFG